MQERRKKMAKPRGLRKKVLDGKELFYRFYVEMGKASSLPKLAKALQREGIYNYDLGKAFTTGAIFMSMWRWALQNLDEALPVYKKYILEFGEIIPEDDLKAAIVVRVECYLNKTQKREFYEKHPEYHKP